VTDVGWWSEATVVVGEGGNSGSCVSCGGII